MTPNYVMIIGLITLTFFSLSLGDDVMLPRHNNLIAKPNCNESCGNVNIPFPFGVTQDCILHDQFLVTCNYSFQPPQPFLGNSDIEITSISLTGQLDVLQFISRDCYSAGQSTIKNRPWIRLPPLLSVNYTANKFIAVGCDTYAIVRGNYHKYNPNISDSYITGCMSICKSIDAAADGDYTSCSGVGCCQTSLPNGARNVTIRLSSYYNHTNLTNNPSCSYAFVVKEANFSFSKSYLSSLQKAEKLPLVLDWAIGEETCEIAKRNSNTYGCKSKNSDCHDNSNGYRCSCLQGYDGNPYLKDGCQDINECIDRKSDNRCAKDAICHNTEGNYTCICLPNFSGNGIECSRDNPQSKIHNIYLVIDIIAGVALMVIIVFGWSYTAFQRRKILMMKKKCFQENGGLVLLQRLKGEEGSSNTNTVKIFTAEELQRATNDIDKDRVVLVELLTGRKALCFERPEEERSLAQYFISSVEKGHLFDILDDNIVCDEGNAGQLKNVAVIAQRCLNVKGDDRPTMKEVAAELEAGSRLKHSWAQTDQHSEEIESLLHDTQPLGSGYQYSEHSFHIDSVTNHVTLPFPGGR